MVYYKLVKVTINILDLIKVIFKLFIKQYNILNSIIDDRDKVFMLKF